MKKKLYKLMSIGVLMIAPVLTATANDGVFYVRGNNLIPLQETQVELRKEVLKFYVDDFNWMRVDVDFSFYNPGPSKEVIVGFVTPPGSGDIDENDAKHPQIRDFTVRIDGADTPFEIKRMADTDFSYGKLKLEDVDFVYYFKVRFKRGTTRIRHTYKYRGGSSVELQRDFEYQITTGKRWANKQIDDFEMQVHLDNGVYSVPASFWNDKRLADWQIVGHGALSNGTRQWFDGPAPAVRMAHLNRGYLRLTEKNFKPDSDIIFAEYNWAAGWVERWCDFAAECLDREALKNIVRYFDLNPWDGIIADDLKELSKKELRLVRNYYYAVRGYDFKTTDLKKFYSQFFWYKPDPKLKLNEVVLSEAERSFVKKVKKAEES